MKLQSREYKYSAPVTDNASRRRLLRARRCARRRKPVDSAARVARFVRSNGWIPSIPGNPGRFPPTISRALPVDPRFAEFVAEKLRTVALSSLVRYASVVADRK